MVRRQELDPATNLAAVVSGGLTTGAKIWQEGSGEINEVNVAVSVGIEFVSVTSDPGTGAERRQEASRKIKEVRIAIAVAVAPSLHQTDGRPVPTGPAPFDPAKAQRKDVDQPFAASTSSNCSRA